MGVQLNAFTHTDFILVLMSIIGVLIKLELHDVKVRMTRLENIFIKKGAHALDERVS